MKPPFFPAQIVQWLLNPRWIRRSIGFLLAATLGMATAGGKPPYSYSITGSDQSPVPALAQPSTPSIVLMGGGPDVDEAEIRLSALSGLFVCEKFDRPRLKFGLDSKPRLVGAGQSSPFLQTEELAEGQAKNSSSSRYAGAPSTHLKATLTLRLTT